ncbi:MAG: DNA mismatch repair protein MutS, partial [Deltaproteobacteria bacterium]
PLQRAAGAILRYVLETQKVEPAHIRPLEVYRTEQYLILDETTQRNLELFSPLRGSGRKGSLLGVLDRTVTAMGRRRLRQWLAYPLRDLVEIGRRLEAVASLKEAPLERDTLRELLEGVSDIERLNARLALGRANPRELVALKESLERVPEIRERLLSFGSDLLQEIAQGLDPLEEVVQKIGERIVDDPPATVTEGGIIRDGYHQELDELRSISREGKGWIAKLEAEERRRTGIPSLKVGYNQVFGYYIEVTRPNLPLVPEDYVRKQTLKGAERFITPKLKEYERKVLGAEERIKALEYELFLRLREELMAYCPRIQGLARRLSELDVLISLAQVAEENRYVRPSLTEEDRIEIKEGRHPVIEQMDLPEPFVPNDALLDQQNRILIITGPNMAGKSTYIRQVALIVIMAQMGSFVPAKEAEVGLVDRIFTRVGASDNIARGESTFMVEMRETAAILQGATPRSLVILDEIGRGTSTFDGLSIAWAVAEYLHDVKGPKVLFATHYHELTELASRLPGVKNYHIAVREWKGEVVFLRQVLPGGMSRSYGIQVARLAGLPQEVIGRAKEVLSELEKGEVRRRREELQLSLFVPQESPVIRELKRIDPDRLTPLEALELLYRWKRETEG